MRSSGWQRRSAGKTRWVQRPAKPTSTGLPCFRISFVNTQALPESDPLAIATVVSLDVARQPDLFGPAAFSDSELGIVRAARAGRYNASRTQDEARVAVVVALRQQGCSLREIERRTGMDPRLVAVVVAEAERNRAVPAIKEALTRRLAETTERALDRLDDEIAAPKPDPALVRALGVAVGIGADKVAGSGSPAGDLHLHQHVHLAGADPARDYLRQRAAALATESDSVSTSGNHGRSGSVSHAAAELAAAAGRGSDRSGPVIDIQSESDRPGDRPVTPPGGGADQATGASE